MHQAINQFTVFELDDFTCDEASLYALTKLKQRYPSFKATLFTVYGKCDLEKLRELVKLDWLEIAAHGSDHATERFWDYETASNLLVSFSVMGCRTKIFKMPWDDMPTEDFIDALRKTGYSFATRNRLYGSFVNSRGITTYLGCPQSMWLHPFQLDSRIDVPMPEPFLTVSEVMQLPQAKEMGWVL